MSNTNNIKILNITSNTKNIKIYGGRCTQYKPSECALARTGFSQTPADWWLSSIHHHLLYQHHHQDHYAKVGLRSARPRLDRWARIQFCGVLNQQNYGNQPKTMINHETTLKSHGNQPKTMKNHETTLKNHGNQPKTMKNHETNLKNHGNQPKTMKPTWKTMETNQKPWKTMKSPWKTMETPKPQNPTRFQNVFIVFGKLNIIVFQSKCCSSKCGGLLDYGEAGTLSSFCWISRTEITEYRVSFSATVYPS